MPDLWERATLGRGREIRHPRCGGVVCWLLSESAVYLETPSPVDEAFRTQAPRKSEIYHCLYPKQRGEKHLLVVLKTSICGHC